MATLNNNYTNYFYRYNYTNNFKSPAETTSISSVAGNGGYKAGNPDWYRAYRFEFTISGGSASTLEFSIPAGMIDTTIAEPDKNEDNCLFAFISKEKKTPYLFGNNVTSGANTDPNGVSIDVLGSTKVLYYYGQNPGGWMETFMRGTINGLPLVAGTTYYLYIIPASESEYGLTYVYNQNAEGFRGTFTLSGTVGSIYIDNGSGWDAYQVYIDNGTSWDLCVAYIDNGSSWDILG